MRLLRLVISPWPGRPSPERAIHYTSLVTRHSSPVARWSEGTPRPTSGDPEAEFTQLLARQTFPLLSTERPKPLIQIRTYARDRNTAARLSQLDFRPHRSCFASSPPILATNKERPRPGPNRSALHRCDTAARNLRESGHDPNKQPTAASAEPESTHTEWAADGATIARRPSRNSDS